MENGSIFVCFVCESEFRDVSDLNDHMAEHDVDPGMLTSTEPQGIDAQKVNSEMKEEENCALQSSDYPHYSTVNMEPSHETEEPFMKVSEAKRIKREFPSTKNKVESLTKDNPNENSNDIKAALKRAMNLKKYIERQVKAAQERLEESNKKDESKTLEGGDGIGDEEKEQEIGYDGPQESVMMVDSSFFDSDETQILLGPTVLNAAEPEGFIIPQRYVFPDETGGKINKDADSFKERMEGSEEESDSFSEDFFSEPFSTGCVNGIRSYIKQGAHVFGGSKKITTIHNRGRGRGRGKRGRPSKLRIDQSVDGPPVLYNRSERTHRKSEQISVDDVSGISYQCTHCFKEFKSLSTMKIHCKSHMEDKEIPCPYCDEVFPQRYLLYDHLITDHDDECSSLVCPVCKKVFTRPDSMKSHMVRMHEENGGLNCRICGKNFPSHGQLEMHVRVHTGERPFKCDICSKGFVQKVHLNTHLRTMHNMTNANTTPCRICDQKFSGRATLREHFMSIHQMNTTQYKNQVAKLRKEGKIPEILPPKVKVVDPSFRYKKLDVSEMTDGETYSVYTRRSSKNMNGLSSGRDHSTELGRGTSNRKIKISNKNESRAPGMGVMMNMVTDDMMFTPMNFGSNSEPRGRDQEELNIVESAFKVAEEMDHLRDGSSAILMTDDSSSSGIYYSLPIDMSEDVDGDEEYAQFAAEHAHIDGVDGFDVIEGELDDSESVDQRHLDPGVASKSNVVNCASQRTRNIVKTEPIDLFSTSSEASDSTTHFKIISM